MNRTVLIAGGVLIAAALLLYLFVFRTTPAPDPRLTQLIDSAERVCLSDSDSSKKATVQGELKTVGGVNATASAGTASQERRGAVDSLSDALKVEQDDHIRTCMQPFVAQMIHLTR